MTHVLAVEDSPTQAEVLHAELTDAGFTVRLARSAPEALALLASESFDLVVSDVVMPDMDGYELCRRVKQNPHTRDVPVVLLTSLVDPLDVVNGLESGADNFIRKPYQPEQLSTRLRTTLHNRELRKTGRMQMGIHLSFLDRDFQITAERQQILDLLITTFEELVVSSREVRAREEELARAHAEVAQQLHATELERNRLRTVIDSVPIPLIVIGPDGRIDYANELSAQVHHTSLHEVCGRDPDELVLFIDADGNPIPSADLPRSQAMQTGRPAEAGTAFDVFLRQPDGSRAPVVLQASPVLDDRGHPAGCVSTAQIVGALSRHDPVTGLPSRTAFLDRIAGMLSLPTAQSALLLVELDRFDVARAALDHEAGNQLLGDAARQLRQALDHACAGVALRDCFLAYLGGEQFGIMLADAPDQNSVVRIAEAIRAQVSDWSTTAVDGSTVSVGVSIAAGTDHEAPQLLAAAGAALRHARSGGGDRIELFGPQASQEAINRLQLEADLRDAVSQGHIEMHYQPEIDLTTGQLLGFEALARWRHPRLGFVRPDQFIALAEESTLILALGRHILTTACRQAALWTPPHGQDPLTVAVNISAVQLRPELVGEVTAILHSTGLDPTRLILEVTETTAMGDPESTVAVLDQLRRHGVRFSLDDFGTGYSSLAYLTRLRFDQLKLDRAFVAGITHDGVDSMIAQNVIALARSLDVPVLAEGVEEPAQADTLRLLGCHQAQGYLFAAPMDPAAADVYIAEASQGQLLASAGVQANHAR